MATDSAAGLAKPAGLGPEGSSLWEKVVSGRSGDLEPSDSMLLMLLCQWFDASQEQLSLARAAERPLDALNRFKNAGIATDKVLAFCSSLGIGPAERKKLGVSDKKRPEGRKRTSLDDLTPEKLGVERQKLKEKKE